MKRAAKEVILKACSLRATAKKYGIDKMILRSVARSTAFNKHTVDQLFALLREVLEREHLRPDAIYNCENTGVQTFQRPGKIISQKEQKHALAVADAVYFSDWYSQYYPFLRYPVCVMIQNAQEEITIKAGGLIDMNAATVLNWSGNSNDILAKRGHVNYTTELLFNNDETIKTLGMSWNRISDNMSFSVKDFTEVNIVSKRTILSSISKLFDPIGLVTS
ncbi:hypothetical protein ILUMI_09886, partial [Ignelater luminosus]